MMTDKHNIRNIVFDLGGVLVDLNAARCKEAFCALGMPQMAALIDPCYPAEIFARMERGDLSAHETCDEIRRLTQRPDVSDEAIAGAYQVFVAGIPVEKLRLLERLRREGYGVYMLSNNNPLVMPYIASECFTIDGHDMPYYFDRIYLSYELHELKPSPEIFRRVIGDSGIRPEETLFVDDGARNVQTARELGFHTYMPAPREAFSPRFDEILTGC